MLAWRIVSLPECGATVLLGLRIIGRPEYWSAGTFRGRIDTQAARKARGRQGGSGKIVSAFDLSDTPSEFRAIFQSWPQCCHIRK